MNDMSIEEIIEQIKKSELICNEMASLLSSKLIGLPRGTVCVLLIEIFSTIIAAYADSIFKKQSIEFPIGFINDISNLSIQHIKNQRENKKNH
jgi:hypothetical protein